MKKVDLDQRRISILQVDSPNNPSQNVVTQVAFSTKATIPVEEDE